MKKKGKETFVEVGVLDNFYQTSSFYPMPVVLVSTLAPTGHTNLGPYSLCFPHLIAGKHGMMLLARYSSNTAQNIIRTGVCAINFLPGKKAYMENCVALGYPGETTMEKMKNSIFTLLPPTCEPGAENSPRPEIVQEAIQVFECSLDPSTPPEYNEKTEEAHFVLLIDKIVMQKQWHDELLSGKSIAPIAIGYGFRDNRNFWFEQPSRKYTLPVPESKGIDVAAVKWAASRCDSGMAWTDEAYTRLVKVPRVFLDRVVAQCIEAAKTEGVTEITPEFLDQVRDKHFAARGESDPHHGFFGAAWSWLHTQLHKLGE
jgi:flavin reductase (DIM6/NTAB) family NADH-FMN oxidoreductase RutF